MAGDLIEWGEAWQIGIEELDDHHRVLVDLINELDRAIKEKNGSVVCVAILNDLYDYTRVTFAVEESLMRLMGYPDYAAHKQQHESLVDGLEEISQKYSTGTNVSFELLSFLRAWLLKHIHTADRAYVPYLLAKGVTPVHREPPRPGRQGFWYGLMGGGRKRS